jgi:hypothetical protein
MKQVKMTKSKVKQIHNSACGKGRRCAVIVLPTFKKAA